MKAETLARVVSKFDQAGQEASRPEPTREMSCHLDSSQSIEAKMMCVSTMLVTTEHFRLKYKVMSGCWLLV